MSQKTAEILQQLEQGVQSLLDSDTYRNYLEFLSKGFHTYSFRNSLLLYTQCQQRGITPTLLAPYRQWQKKHRHIKRGEQGLAIFCPHSFKAKKPNSDEEHEQLGFHIGYTFDVSQTEADDPSGEIPEICHKLTGNLSDETLLDTLVAVSPVPVRFEPISGGANGFFSIQNSEIVVDNTNSQTQQLKTLIHEQAHAWHYKLDPDSFSFFGKCPSNEKENEKEIVAEASAYVVANYCNIDSSDYSFGYLANYSGNDTKSLKNNLDLIRRISDKIISEIELHQEQQQ